MKKSYWITIGAVFAITVAGLIWMEGIRTRSQDVTIYELSLPKPDIKPEEIVLLDVLNEHFQKENLQPAVFFQGFQSRRRDGQIFAGSFSYSQIDDVRRKLDQLSQKRADIEWAQVFEERGRYGKVIAIPGGASLKLNAEPDETPVEATVKLGPEAEALVAHFYDGHTMLFANAADDKLRILFITMIFPSESNTTRILDWFKGVFE